MPRSSERLVGWALVVLIVLLTLATGYVHYLVGGIMLTLNALGYLGLAALVVGAAIAFRRALPLVLLAVAAYAAVTIIGWLVMGPYYDVAYLAKAIEVALIATIAVTLWRSRDELRESLTWGRSLVRRA
jgi:hypothetical protein